MKKDQDLEFVELTEEEFEEAVLEEDVKDKVASAKRTTAKASSKKNGKKNNKKADGANVIQIIIGIVMLVLIIVATLSVMKWQKGKDIVIRPEDLTEDYNVETVDYIEYYDPRKIDGYQFDGTWDIVILGDCLMYEEDEKTGIAGSLASITDANVTALSLPDQSISLKYDIYDPNNYAQDAFCLYALAMCITMEGGTDYSMQDIAMTFMKDPSIYEAYMEKLKEIDFDKVDTLILQTGLYDYLDEHETANEVYWEGNPYGAPIGIDSALYAVLSAMRDKYPYMQIVVSSPPYVKVKLANGKYEGADLHRNGESGSLGDYIGSMSIVTAGLNISFVDNYFGSGISFLEEDGFYEENGTKLSDKGCEAIAKHIASILYRPK